MLCGLVGIGRGRWFVRSYYAKANVWILDNQIWKAPVQPRTNMYR
jgi:hypothetical protein